MDSLAPDLSRLGVRSASRAPSAPCRAPSAGPPSSRLGAAFGEPLDDDDVTVLRRIPRAVLGTASPVASPSSQRVTTRMQRVDESLLALARGELPPDLAPLSLDELDDPFGGLIPVYDEEEEDGVETEPVRIAIGAVPRVVLAPEALAELPVDERARFLLDAVDGERSIQELAEATFSSTLETRVLVWALLRLGAIELT